MSMDENDMEVSFPAAIIFAFFSISLNKKSILFSSKSLISKLSFTFPGITFGAPGKASILPTVPT